MPHTPMMPFTPKPGEGVIMISGHPNLSLLLVAAMKGIRRVIIDSIIPRLPCVLTDNADGMTRLVDHLKGLGHKRLLLVWESTGFESTTNGNERREAFERLTHGAGLHGEVIAAATPEEVLQQLHGPKSPTAVLFTRDDAALKFIDAAREAGIKVPQDVSVTGFDDLSLESRDISQLTPPRINGVALGRLATRRVITYDELAEKTRPWIRVPGQLVIRASTGPVTPHKTRR